MGNFEFDGQKYKKASAHQKEWGSRIVYELNLTGTESILDLGCGDGVMTKQLADLVPDGKVLGIDASVGMINTAKELEGFNLSFSCLDIIEMEFKNEFDLIFSNATLHWIKDHESLLNSCFNALKLNDVLRFNFAGDGNCTNFYEVIRYVINLPTYCEYFVNFEWPWFMPKLDNYKELIMKQNFRELEVWDENADRYFKNQDEIIKWIDQPSIVPFLKHVSEAKKEGFRNEVISRMVQNTIQTDGTCFETFRRINILARK